MTPASEYVSQFLNHPQLSIEIRKIEQEETRLNYALQMDKSFMRAAEDALSNAIQIDFGSVNDGQKHASICLVESGLTDLVHNGALDDSLHQNIKK